MRNRHSCLSCAESQRGLKEITTEIKGICYEIATGTYSALAITEYSLEVPSAIFSL